MGGDDLHTKGKRRLLGVLVEPFPSQPRYREERRWTERLTTGLGQRPVISARSTGETQRSSGEAASSEWVAAPHVYMQGSVGIRLEGAG